MTTANVSFKLTLPKSDLQNLADKGDCHAAIRIFERLTKIPVASVDAMSDSISIMIDSSRLRTLAPRPPRASANPNDNDDRSEQEIEEESVDDAESEMVTRLRNELDELRSISAARLFQLNDYRWMVHNLPPILPYDQDQEQQQNHDANNPSSHLPRSRPREQKVETQSEELADKQQENDKLRIELAEYQRLTERFQKTLAEMLENH